LPGASLWLKTVFRWGLILFAMVASSLAGVIWFWLGAEATFISTSVVTVLVIFYFVFIIRIQKAKAVVTL
jgi:hypothetical protein